VLGQFWALKLDRRQVVQRAVPAQRVVEVLDVVGDGHGQLDLGGPFLAVEQFDLHRAGPQNDSMCELS